MRSLLILAVISAFHIGCIEPEDSRSFEDFTEDYEAIQNGTFTGFGFDATTPDGGADEGVPDMRDPNQQCSVAGDPTTVQFENATGQDADLVWINYECNPVVYGQLAAGASLQQQTFIGHVWQLVSNGRVISEQVVEQPAVNVVFR